MPRGSAGTGLAFSIDADPAGHSLGRGWKGSAIVEPEILPPIESDAVSVGFESVAVLPPSAAGQPLARVQQVVSVPGLDDAYAALDTRGLVWLIEDGAVRETPLADLRGTGGFVEPGGEAGLRSIAFHPDFATPGTEGFGRLYLAYSAGAESQPGDAPVFSAPGAGAEFFDVVEEFTAADPADPVVDTAEGRVLLRIAQPFGNHNFGQLGFNPEAAPGDADYGNLYLSIGDGGGGNDPLDAAGDLGLIYGKILRINPLGGEGAQPYAVPADNPFVGDDAALPEILAYGFRNPQQFSFDDGLIFTGDIGQNTVEEIDVVRIGGHHGWDVREGTLANTNGAIGPLPAEDAAFDFQYPITQYGHDAISAGNAAVAGGFVYRGEDIPALQGTYVFSNFPTGELFYLPLDALDAALEDGRIDPSEVRAPLTLGLVDADGAETSFAEIAGSPGGRVDLRFGLTETGELLAFSKQTGEIFQLTGSGGPGIGAGLSETEARSVAYLYETALDRDGAIDLDGLNFWIDSREQGLGEAELAEEFLRADEFAAAFGDVDTLGDRDLVALFYRNVLEREGEAAGIDFWTEAVGQPGFGRNDLLLAFATSVENTEPLAFVETLAETAPGFWEFAA